MQLETLLYKQPDQEVLKEIKQKVGTRRPIRRYTFVVSGEEDKVIQLVIFGSDTTDICTVVLETSPDEVLAWAEDTSMEELAQLINNVIEAMEFYVQTSQGLGWRMSVDVFGKLEPHWKHSDFYN